MSIKKIMYKIVFASLFIGAIYTSVSSITNVTIVDLKDSLTASAAEEVYSPYVESVSERENRLNTVVTEREMNLREKKLTKQLDDKKYISSEQIEGAKTLEEAMNLSDYPSEKVVATGYTAGVESTGKSPGHPQYGITYSGVQVKRDLYSTIAADLNTFPLGTILYIPDYGYGVVADIGGAIKGNSIDLYYETVEQVYEQWGKKEVEVFVIEKGDGKITEQELVALNENEALQVFRQEIIDMSKE